MAAGNQQGIVLCRIGVGKRDVDRKRIALVVVIGGLHFVFLRRDQRRLRSRLLQSGARFLHLDLLESVFHENRNAESI